VTFFEAISGEVLYLFFLFIEIWTKEYNMYRGGTKPSRPKLKTLEETKAYSHTKFSRVLQLSS